MHQVLGPLLISFAFGATVWMLLGEFVIALGVWVVVFVGAYVGRGRL